MGSVLAVYASVFLFNQYLVTITGKSVPFGRGPHLFYSPSVDRKRPNKNPGLYRLICVFFHITRYPSSISCLLWFLFQLGLISHLHWVLSLFRHNIQSSVTQLVISAASRVCVRVCVWDTSSSANHTDQCRWSGWSVRKEKQAIVFWTRSTTMDQTCHWRSHSLSHKS